MKRIGIAGAVAAMALAIQASAQEITRGQVTNLPVPRFVSMKSATANVRRGPSTTNRIDWKLTHRGTPLLVLAEYQEWFRVVDVDGEGGWVHTALLSPARTVLVQEDMLALRKSPDNAAAPLARLEAGVIARLDTCDTNWCEIRIDGYTGWLPRDRIWGDSNDLPNE